MLTFNSMILDRDFQEIRSGIRSDHLEKLLDRLADYQCSLKNVNKAYFEGLQRYAGKGGMELMEQHSSRTSVFNLYSAEAALKSGLLRSACAFSAALWLMLPRDAFHQTPLVVKLVALTSWRMQPLREWHAHATLCSSFDVCFRDLFRKLPSAAPSSHWIR